MYKFLTKNGQTIAFGLGAVLVILFYALVVSNGNYETFTTMDADGVKDTKRYEFSLFDFGLIVTIALIIIGAILMLGFGLFQAATDIKGSLGAIVGLAVIGIIFAVGYSVTEIESSGMVYQSAVVKFNLTDSVRKFVGGSIITGLSLISLATIGIIVSEIRNFFK
ncbi:MAG: hypothetical protein AAF573_03090 [Bacteroidota bacterium]